MTLDEFYDKLRAVAPNFWWAVIYGCIRTVGGEGQTTNVTCCPITAFQSRSSSFWRQSAKQLGLSHADAKTITAAADQEPNHEPAVRRALLRAVGLEAER